MKTFGKMWVTTLAVCCGPDLMIEAVMFGKQSQTRDMCLHQVSPKPAPAPFEYFVDKVYIRHNQIVIASYYHDSARPIEFEDLEEVLLSGDRAREVRTYARKRELDTSPGVEMAGIEPASLKGEPGILRAQLTKRSTRPLHSCQQVAARPSPS